MGGFIEGMLRKGISYSISWRFWGPWRNAKVSHSRKWSYFSDEEVEGLKYDFVEKLDLARKIAGIPFVITSGFRTPEKNQSLAGAVQDSAHTKGLAVDLRVASSEEAGIVCDALADAGILRRGIYVNKKMQPVHVHCDVDPDKKPECCIYVRMEEN